MSQTKIYAPTWKDYELIDAGGSKKLERWGDIITIRPERQAYFKSGLSYDKWYEQAHWEFEEKGKKGFWKQLQPDAPKSWTVTINDLKIELALTKFKHIGLFPEQMVNWKYITQELNSEKRMLNLFAYTGVASLVGRATKADVVHVDAVKQVISWSRKNMELSQLSDIRWVHEDALKFAQREVKRGNKYDLLIMDPPAWGIGANNEKWKLEDQLPELMILAKNLLTQGGALILNTYSPQIKTNDIQRLVTEFFPTSNLSVQELWMKSAIGKELYFGLLCRGVLDCYKNKTISE